MTLVDAIAGQPVLCIGDIMLDEFVYGQVDRISPEAPIPVLAVKRRVFSPGGSGNVAYNLSGLGCIVHVAAVTGNDNARTQLLELLGEKGVDTQAVLVDDTRPTTRKTRFVVGPQQLLRADDEKSGPLAAPLAAALAKAVIAKLDTVKAVILSDYGKGVLDNALISAVIAAANKKGVPVLVDPKGSDYTRYKGADVVTPNRKELSEATRGAATQTDADIESAAAMLISGGIKAVLATRSADGMSVVAADGTLHLTTKAREVYDVSGAGDTVIATTAAALAAGASLFDAARLANIAGGLVVEKIGTAPIYAKDLRRAVADATHMAASHVTTFAPVLGWQAAKEQVERWRTAGYKIGFTNGCYDLLHQGHVMMLDKCSHECDRLVVAVNTDASVKRLKGETRPVNNQNARASVIASLSSVDLVVLFGDSADEADTPRKLIAMLEPDVLMKGADYTAETVVGHEIVTGYGGRVALIPLEDGFSTTGTIKKMTAA